jgi:uncharacterized membrane protein
LALEHKTRRWTDAGLITSDQAAAIAVFEERRSKPTFLIAIAGLGGLAIAIGLVSIVASNWDAIPGRLKVAVAVALVGASGAGVVRLQRTGPTWLMDTLALVAHGLVLATIALVGQVYQLGGETHTALALWLVLSGLLLTRARSGVAAWVAIVSVQLTYFSWLVFGVDHAGLDGLLGVGAGPWAALACVAAGRSPWLQGVRPIWARACDTAGWFQLVLLASVGTAAFYETLHEDQLSGLWMACGVALVAATMLAGARFRQSPALRTGGALLVGSVALIYLPPLLSEGNLDLVGALVFLALWLGVAFAAYRGRRLWLLNGATAVIGVRLLVVYFEVFGSLLTTGVGLVSGGLLTVGLAWVWARKRKEFGAELAEEAS